MSGCLQINSVKLPGTGRDTDSKSKANNLLHAVSNFEFIITQITTMKCLSTLKPLSIKLQKRDIDVYEAYNHIKDLKGELQDIRGDIDKYCSDWYGMAKTTGRKANIEPSMPRVFFSATAQKQCRSRNTEGLLQKSAHNSSIRSSYFRDRHIL